MKFYWPVILQEQEATMPKSTKSTKSTKTPKPEAKTVKAERQCHGCGKTGTGHNVRTCPSK